MRIRDMNWMQVQTYLENDDRVALPLGSTEQHAHLSLSTDSILAERLAVEAAEPLGVPVYPVVDYGLTPSLSAYPGTVTLRLDTYLRLIRDILDSLARIGFKRIFVVNGHGGNSPAHALALEWMADTPAVQVKFHNWWAAPDTSAKAQEIDPVSSHAAWNENFPWTRVPNAAMPTEPKPPVGRDRVRLLSPEQVRAEVGDGNFGGHYQHSDEEMYAIWAVAVEETRALLANW